MSQFILEIDIAMPYTTLQIAELFPDIQSIRCATMRDQVAAVWSEALSTGCGGKGWTFDEIRAIPFTLLAGKIDLRFVEHLNSCVRQCIAIEKVLNETFGDRIPVDHDALVAGALLADVGKMLEFDKDSSGRVIKGEFGELVRHPFSGVALAFKHGLPGSVMHIIATHSHEGDKADRTIESIIFHHADFVDFDIAKFLGKRAK
ncbi:MAG: HD domain-containing protein [Planctomycetota bacterium]|nr:HD domain-containing protein [Planctomycetota bacterium]